MDKRQIQENNTPYARALSRCVNSTGNPFAYQMLTLLQTREYRTLSPKQRAAIDRICHQYGTEART